MISKSFGWNPEEKASQFLVSFAGRHNIVYKLSQGRVRRWLQDAEHYRFRTTQHNPHVVVCSCDSIVSNSNRHQLALTALTSKVLSQLESMNSARKLEDVKFARGTLKYRPEKRGTIITVLTANQSRVTEKTLLRQIHNKSIEMTRRGLRERLKRLKEAKVVSLTGKGVLLLRPRSRPVLLMPAPKPFPVSSKTGCERKTISRTELRNRNWSSAFIHFLFDEEDTHVRKMHMPAQWDSTKTILCRYYPVALIKDLELSPEFHELRRAMNAECKERGGSDSGPRGQQTPTAQCDPTDSYREAA